MYLERIGQLREMVVVGSVVTACSASVGDGRGEMQRGSLIFPQFDDR